MDKEKLSKVLEAARLYYLLDYNQNEIAKILGISRPTVSRLLQQAKSEGIVQITIMDPTEDVENLAIDLEKKFNLKIILSKTTLAKKRPCIYMKL